MDVVNAACREIVQMTALRLALGWLIRTLRPERVRSSTRCRAAPLADASGNLGALQVPRLIRLDVHALRAGTYNNFLVWTGCEPATGRTA